MHGDQGASGRRTSARVVLLDDSGAVLLLCGSDLANPPYGISSRLLRTLLAPNSGLVAADLVLQRALVCKFASRNARRFTLTVGLMLPRRAFLPPPHVDSAVLVVRRRKCGDWQGR